MAVAQSNSYIPVSESYGQRREASPEQAASLIGGALIAAPPGWRLAGCYTSSLKIGFARGDDPDALAGVTNSAGDSRIPVVRETTVPVAHLLFEKGQASLEAQLAPTADRLASVWADSLLSHGTVTALGPGKGFAVGPSAVISADSQLIRLTYDDGSHGGSQANRDTIARGALAVAMALGR
jgi:hypothetical protein